MPTPAIVLYADPMPPLPFGKLAVGWLFLDSGIIYAKVGDTEARRLNGGQGINDWAIGKEVTPLWIAEQLTPLWET
jgi:hypothetical protein